MRLVQCPPTSTAPPVINFATTNPPASRPQPVSIVQKLCADYERTLAAFKIANDAYCKADSDAMNTRPPVHPLIRATKRNLADVPDYIGFNKDRPLARQRCPLTSGEIQREINLLRKNAVRITGSGKNRTVVHCEKGFPLTSKQKALLVRLEARLPIAQAYEAELTAIKKRFELKDLDKAQWVPGDKLRSLGHRIAKTPSKDRQDMLAKARVCEVDLEADETHEITASIASDFVRLAAAGAV